MSTHPLELIVKARGTGWLISAVSVGQQVTEWNTVEGICSVPSTRITTNAVTTTVRGDIEMPGGTKLHLLLIIITIAHFVIVILTVTNLHTAPEGCNTICSKSNLNSVYSGTKGANIYWSFSGNCNLRSAEMKIRPS